MFFQFENSVIKTYQSLLTEALADQSQQFDSSFAVEQMVAAKLVVGRIHHMAGCNQGTVGCIQVVGYNQVVGGYIQVVDSQNLLLAGHTVALISGQRCEFQSFQPARDKLVVVVQL